MTKGHGSTTTQSGSLPADAREALQWFVNTHGLYVGSTRGLFISEWAAEQEATLEAAAINLKSRGFQPLAVTGETLYKQADYLWKESRAHTSFGRPLASKLELELGGSEVVVVDNLEAPENSRHLWYLWSHVLYPRAVSGKPTIITTPLSYEEFVKYGKDCNDPDFCGKAINWEKLIWLIEAAMITLDVLKLAHEQGLPPMLKAELELYLALKERGMEVVPQHVLTDYILDFALFDKEKRLDIEVDTVSTLGSVEAQRQEATRNLVLFSDDWQVLKFTTADILSNKVACVDAVDDVWRSGRKRSGVGRLLTGHKISAPPSLPVDDDVQLAAITHGGGPTAVCGGAGTGKTTCVVQRVVYLLSEGINPENILVITHGTDTQRSLKRTLEQLLDKQAMQRLTVFSWQDLGLRILKENMPAIKRKPPLKVEPSPQKIVQRLLAKVKKEIDPAKLELSVDLDEFYIAAVISMYKAHLISPKQAKEEANTYGEEIIAKIYQQLEDQLQKANRIDRDDVISLAVQVMLDTPELRARYQRQYEFVLIDEYQDVTVAQDMLGRLLAAPQDNLMLAGDEDEAVCEAKNACPELFTEISLRMPQARCFTLERNWRSHPAIVDHARQLISGLKKRRVNKEYTSAWGQAPASAIVGPAALADEHAEANWVAQEIQLLVDGGRPYGDIAILFRHHVYATILEEALDQRKIHFKASNPISNFVPDEVEDMMAFLRLVVDPDGPRARECFERVCQLRVKEIDPKLSATIASFGEANNLSYLKAVEIYSDATSDQSCSDLSQLVRIIRTMHQEKLPPAETIGLIRRTLRLNEYYQTIKVPAGVNYEPLKKLNQLEEEARDFKTNSDFIKHVSSFKQSPGGVADQGVQVLPILDSKGMEFPVVFMVGMSEGIFPAQNAIDLEEERRICYLGFTRAKEVIYLSYPQMFSGAILQPSHFLVEARLLAALPVQMAPLPVASPPAVAPAASPADAAYLAPTPQQMPGLPQYLPPPEQPMLPQQPAAYDPLLYAQQPQEYYAADQQYQQLDPNQYQQQPQYTQQYSAQEQSQVAPEQGYALPEQQYIAPEQQYALPEQQYIAADQEYPTAPQYLSQQHEQLALPSEDWREAEPIEAQAEAPPALPVEPVYEAHVFAGAASELESVEAAHEAYLNPQPQQEPMPAAPPAPVATPVEPATAVSSETPAPPAAVFDVPPELVAALEPLQSPEQPAAPPAPPASPAVEPVHDPFRIYTAEPDSGPSGLPQLPKSKGESLRKSRSKAQPAAEKPVQPEPVQPPSEPPQVKPLPAAARQQRVAESQPPQAMPAAVEPVIAPAQSEPQQPIVLPPAVPLNPVQLPVRETQPLPAAAQHQPPPAAAQQEPVGVEPLAVPASLEQQLFKVFGDLPDIPAAKPLSAPLPPVTPAQPSAAPPAPPARTAQPSAPLPQPPGRMEPPAAEPARQAPPAARAPIPAEPVYNVSSSASLFPPAAVPPQYPVDGGHPLCPACRMQLEANARFCSECGYSLPSRIPACPTCNAPLELSAKFCGECGMDLNAPVAGDSTHFSNNMVRMQDLKEKQTGWVNKLWKMLEN